MTPPGDPEKTVHVVVVFDSTERGTQTDLVARLHWVLHNNPAIATCTIVAVTEGGVVPPFVGGEGDRQLLLDRRLVSKVTCGGAMRATLEPISQKGGMAIVVRVGSADPAGEQADADERVAAGARPVQLENLIERMSLSYGFEFLRILSGDDVNRDVIRVTSRLTAILSATVAQGADVTLVAASRKRLVQLSPHLPFTKYLLFDVEECCMVEEGVESLSLEDEGGAIPGFVSAALVKASDFILRMEADDDDGEHTLTPVFSPDFQRFQLVTESREIPWADSMASMAPVFDRNSMRAMMESVAEASNNKGIGLHVTIPRTWEIVGQDSDVSDLVYPCLIKSRVACGVPESHQMALVLREEGMIECDMEGHLIAQEYINHGGVLYKVYVGIESFTVMQRMSMPDIGSVTEDMPSIIEFDSLHGLPTRLPWISSDADVRASVPDDCFFAKLVDIARDVVGLSLFGFDVVRRADEVVLLDINYLPRLFEGALGG